MGFLAGVTTMLANAAGPIMAIYLLAMRLDKKEFLGTIAWYFFIVNLVKVPFMVNVGIMNSQTLLTNLALLPGIIVGGVLGIGLAERIPTKTFNRVMSVLAAVVAILLIFRGMVS